MDQERAPIARDTEQLLECVAQRKETLFRTVCEPRKPKPYLFADRWLLASLLQKAIRRSELDVARRAGHQLLLVDPARLWRRLMVVGLEDIGIGDPDAASALIALAGLPQARAMIGAPALALDAALKLGCDAVKERSGDCFGSIAHDFKQASHSLEELPTTGKMAVLSYGHLPWRRRLRAAFLLGQDWAPAQERKAQFELLIPFFRAAEVPETLLAACLYYRGKADDLLPLYVPLAFSLWLASGSLRTVRTLACPASLIGEIPSYGFDPLHTRLGRRAVDVWLKSYLAPPPFSSSQVAIALWNYESASSRHVMDWSLSAEIVEQAQAADLLHRGLSPTHHQEIASWVGEQGAVLQQARQAVWDAARLAEAGAQHAIVKQKGNVDDE